MTNKDVTLTPMADRTQTQFDTTPEVKREIKLLMVHENINSQATLFLSLLDGAYGKKYPALHEAVKAQFANQPSALRKLLGRD